MAARGVLKYHTKADGSKMRLRERDLEACKGGLLRSPLPAAVLLRSGTYFQDDFAPWVRGAGQHFVGADGLLQLQHGAELRLELS
jgi:hypothetical protein